MYQFISFNSTQTPPIRKAESLLHDGDISELLRGRTRTESNHRPLRPPPRPTTARSTEHNRDALKLIERHPRRHPSDLRRDVSGRECIRSSPSLRKNISPRHDRRTTRALASSLSLFLSFLFSFEEEAYEKFFASPPSSPAGGRDIEEGRKLISSGDFDAIFHILNCCGRVYTGEPRDGKISIQSSPI